MAASTGLLILFDARRGEEGALGSSHSLGYN